MKKRHTPNKRIILMKLNFNNKLFFDFFLNLKQEDKIVKPLKYCISQPQTWVHDSEGTVYKQGFSLCANYS